MWTTLLACPVAAVDGASPITHELLQNRTTYSFVATVGIRRRNAD